MRYLVPATCALVLAAGAVGILTTDLSPESEPSPVVGTTPWTVDKVSPPEPVMEDEPVGENQVDVSVVIEPLDEPVMEPDPEPVMEPEPERVIHEDDPEWNCATMGNLKCGVGTDWQGLLVGDVIVCPPGLEVAIDYYPNGVSWAACM